MVKETSPSLTKNLLNTKKAEDEEKKKKEEEEKRKQEEEKKKREKIDLIIDGIKKYINNRKSTKRCIVERDMNVNEDYSTRDIYFGYFNTKFVIKNSDNIDELLSLVKNNEFDKVKIKIKIRYNGVCDYIFDNDVDFTMKDLFDSLNVLGTFLHPRLYNDNYADEYLCVKDTKNSKNKEKLFINLRNGLLYFADSGPIPGLHKVFGFTDEGDVLYQIGCCYSTLASLKCKIEEFIKPVLTKEKIENLKLALDK